MLRTYTTPCNVFNSCSVEGLLTPPANTRACSISPEGTRIVSGSTYNTIRLCNAETRTQTAQLFSGYANETPSVTPLPTGRMIAPATSPSTSDALASTGRSMRYPGRLIDHTSPLRTPPRSLWTKIS